MDAGLQIYNNDGFLQINDQFKNIQFIDKLTFTCDSNPGWGDVISTIPIQRHEIKEASSIDKCLLAFRCENNKFIFWEERYTIIPPYPPYTPGPPIIHVYGEPGAIVTLYRFSYSSIPNGKFFEVKNSNGELVFSDKGKYMKVIDAYNGERPAEFSSASWNTIISNTTHSSLVKTAVAVGCACYLDDVDVYYDSTQALRLSFTFSPTNTTATYQLYRKKPRTRPLLSRYADLNYQYLVLDVTGY